ncbi:MAG: DUF192 domain-containing protein [Parachlamydia sp.]|nr:DUF192 domain-containing protein [Parachlamydia sp.]
MKRFCLLFFLLAIPLFGRETTLTLEHARTPEQRTKGLAGRSFLSPDHGMLFHFDLPQRACIWMHKTLIDLSLAYLDDKGSIREIHELKAYPNIQDPAFFAEHCVAAGFPCSYALEMNRNWFTAHGIGVGDRLVWDGNQAKIVHKNN